MLAEPAHGALLLLAPRGDLDDYDPSKPATRSHDAPLLDFLYPEKTLALIRRLSAYGVDTADSRRKIMLGSGVRQFSTSRWQPLKEENVEDLEAIQAVEEMNELLLITTAEEALQKLLWSNVPGKQELAWHLYSATPDRSRSTRLHCDLLDYLDNPDFTRIAGRALQIFDLIPQEERRSSSYRVAVAAYVALKMVGPAIQLLEEASQRFDATYTGIDAVLKRTIQDDQWDLSFRVFKIFLRSAERDGVQIEKWVGYGTVHRKNWGPIFGQAQHVLEPVEHLQSFLEHIRQFRHELNSTVENKRAIALFANGYVPGVLSEVITTSEPNEDHIWDFCRNLFRDLRSLDLPTSALYEYAILTFLDTPRYQQYTNQRKIFLTLYTSYRKEFLEGYCRAPSRYLINKLIIQHGRHMSYGRVDAMIGDLRSFHSGHPFNVPVLKYLIRFYAQGGLVDRVEELFQELQIRFAPSVNLRIIASLPYAYARRIDVPGTIRQFKRITDEFGLVPDAACWNILLLAFTRADDLDGALECFNNCLESGVKPDLQTFGPMLDLCAARGDVEAFEALFSRAKQLNVPVETDRWARSGYVQAFLNAEDPEGAEAIANGMLQSWQAGTFGDQEITHTWNLLLSHYAVTGSLAETRRIYNQMTANKIPLDSWTYGGLMRSLVEAKQTNAAYKILRVTMPTQNIRVYAFHYALAITGFIREGQFQRAMQVRHRMGRRNVPRTQSLRQASLLNEGINELLKLRGEKIKDPRARLESLEEELRQSLLSDFGHEIANDQPKLSRYIDSPELSNVPQGYFALVIMLYTTRGAYDICKELFEAASKKQAEEQNFEVPITLLTAIMDTHYKAREYDEVAKCWELARNEGSRLVKTFHQVMHPEPPTAEFDSITDPTVKARFEASRIATNRRQILFRASRIYIRSLLAQDDSQSLQQAQRTIHNLLSNGFIIDNITWNEFIQHLATRHRILDAFSACEMYLMPQFPGWANLSPVFIRHYRPGYEWMELRHHDIKRMSVLPRYKTLVVLAAVYAKVKRDERNGLGFNPDLGGWVRELLEQISPLTVRAIETMPKTGDALQIQYLPDV
ncbi:hypothetical protein N0V90_011571 [Kalmusia sp. IMI 367209]|nr:hypothetical protein N0V90_011571 [Kalmusia sp. IMI 367209]